MRLLLSIALPFSLSGCWSQIFLDSVPGDDMSSIAMSAVTKQVYAVSSSACDSPPGATRYQVREYSGGRWIQRCARVRGFEYLPGTDYLLEVKEYPSSDSGERLVLEKVIAQWPKAHGR